MEHTIHEQHQVILTASFFRPPPFIDKYANSLEIDWTVESFIANKFIYLFDQLVLNCNENKQFD